MIKSIKARQILDSRGNPTVEVDVITSNGKLGRASVPSGASTGIHEALELRDCDPSKYMGKSVFKAIDNIQKIIVPKIINMSVFNQNKIDKTMIDLDGTENKSKLGANAMLGVSLAIAKAAAKEKNWPLYKYLNILYGDEKTECFTLPVPFVNVINGGSHSDAPIAFQEFMIVPVGAKNFSHAIQMSTEVFHHLKTLLHKMGLSTSVGDEGGFAPNLKNIDEALSVVTEAIAIAGYENEIKLALDCAASEFFDKEKQHYNYGIFDKSDNILTTEEHVDYLNTLSEKFEIISIEDGVSEDDWQGWKLMTEKLGDKIQLVGDDLFVTNSNRLKTGIQKIVANSILIKLNQIGTLTETIETVKIAKQAGYRCIISHRSGETEDCTISDLAVGLQSCQIKTGSVSRGERTAKYNQLLRIEEELGLLAKYG